LPFESCKKRISVERQPHTTSPNRRPVTLEPHYFCLMMDAPLDMRLIKLICLATRWLGPLLSLPTSDVCRVRSSLPRGVFTRVCSPSSWFLNQFRGTRADQASSDLIGKKTGAAPAKEEKPATIEKSIGGAKNGEKRVISTDKAQKYYPVRTIASSQPSRFRTKTGFHSLLKLG
jgi:hypothetical protein